MRVRINVLGRISGMAIRLRRILRWICLSTRDAILNHNKISKIEYFIKNLPLEDTHHEAEVDNEDILDMDFDAP